MPNLHAVSHCIFKIVDLETKSTQIAVKATIKILVVVINDNWKTTVSEIVLIIAADCGVCRLRWEASMIYERKTVSELETGRGICNLGEADSIKLWCKHLLLGAEYNQ